MLPVWFTPVLHLASQLFFPGAVLVAVLRQRLWGLDLVVSRALVWALLTAGVVATYLAVVAALGPLLTSDEVPEVLAAAIVAAGFQPARVWVQRRVDHLVRGDRRHSAAASSGRSALGSAAPPPARPSLDRSSVAATHGRVAAAGVGARIETDAAVDAEPAPATGRPGRRAFRAGHRSLPLVSGRRRRAGWA